MKRELMATIATALLGGAGAGDFTPPGPAERSRAIGPTEGLDPVLRKALDPGEDFRPIPEPGPGDWLANHPEKGQTFDEFLKSRAKRPDAGRRKIYLLPLGSFPEDRSPSLEKLREFTAIFFSLETVTLPADDIEKLGFTTRINPHTRKLLVHYRAAGMEEEALWIERRLGKIAPAKGTPPGGEEKAAGPGEKPSEPKAPAPGAR